MPAIPLLRSAGLAVETLFDRALCAGGAVAASQGPEFMQQYLQRLEGHLDEARRQLAALNLAATQSGMTLAQFVDNATSNPDASIARLGGVARSAVSRVAELEASDTAIRSASAFGRPFAFAAHFDAAIARSTWEIFRPAVPTTAEGLVYAVTGAALALILYHGIVRTGCRRIWRSRAGRKAADTRAVA